MKKISFDKETQLCIQKECNNYDNCLKNAVKRNKENKKIIPEMFFDIDNGNAYCKTYDSAQKSLTTV